MQKRNQNQNTPNPNSRRRGKLGKRNNEHRERRHSSAKEENKNQNENKEEISPANRAREALLHIKNSGKALRETFYHFLDEGLHEALNFDPGIKGCRQCFKERLPAEQHSSAYRYLQVAHVEIELKLPQGSWPMTVVLKFYAYEECYWKTIVDALGGKPKSAKLFKTKCDDLEIDGKIIPKKTKTESSSDDALGKVKKLLPAIEPNLLEDLIHDIQEIMDKVTTPEN